MLTQLKENNKPLYLTLVCGGGTLLALGSLRCLYVNRGKLCRTLGLCSKEDCCAKKSCCQPKKECCKCCKCDNCECDNCECSKEGCCKCCECDPCDC